jgi:formylglycine-generating enzyme required for sulfatase activity
MMHIVAIVTVILVFSMTNFVFASGANLSNNGNKTYRDPTTGMEFIFVKGGCYQMGDSFGDGYNDEILHEVCIDDFNIGKFEVTQGEYEKVVGNNPSYSKKGKNYPVEKVSWPDTQIFIQKLNTLSSKNYRLPTEAEWEYAARSGGKKEKYSGSNSVDDVAWHRGNSDTTHEVGTKAPNGLGIYDMSGNVSEWCKDWFNMNYYHNSPRDNPQGYPTGDLRVNRGGSYDKALDPYLRNSFRKACPGGENHRRAWHGFRLVLPAKP